MGRHTLTRCYHRRLSPSQETLGFQFWRSGYWKNHLRGMNYHISALYVVDLVRFRQIAAGDQLRAIYDQLSRDPNSLSNLDQVRTWRDARPGIVCVSPVPHHVARLRVGPRWEIRTCRTTPRP